MRAYSGHRLEARGAKCPGYGVTNGSRHHVAPRIVVQAIQGNQARVLGGNAAKSIVQPEVVPCDPDILPHVSEGAAVDDARLECPQSDEPATGWRQPQAYIRAERKIARGRRIRGVLADLGNVVTLPTQPQLRLPVAHLDVVHVRIEIVIWVIEEPSVGIDRHGVQATEGQPCRTKRQQQRSLWLHL